MEMQAADLNTPPRWMQWCQDLGVDLSQVLTVPMDVRNMAEKSNHGDKDVVLRDIQRSMFRLGKSQQYKTKERAKRRRALERVINATFFSKELHYYQGFHSVVEVLFSVCGFDRERQVLLLAKVLATSYFWDATSRASLTSIGIALRLIVPLLYRMSPNLARSLFQSTHDEALLIAEPIWALSWILTLFAHDIDDITILLCIWDQAFKVRHPAFMLYLSAALIIQLQSSLHLDQELPFVYAELSKLPSRASLDDWQQVIALAKRFFLSAPPDTIAKTAYLKCPRYLRTNMLELRQAAISNSWLSTHSIQQRQIAMLTRQGFPFSNATTKKFEHKKAAIVNYTTPTFNKRRRRRRKGKQLDPDNFPLALDSSCLDTLALKQVKNGSSCLDTLALKQVKNGSSLNLSSFTRRFLDSFKRRGPPVVFFVGLLAAVLHGPPDLDFSSKVRSMILSSLE